MQFENISRLEARTFAPSADPARELAELNSNENNGAISSLMRAGGIYTQLGRTEWHQARRSWSIALSEAEWRLQDMVPSINRFSNGPEYPYITEMRQACGVLCLLLGELSEHLGWQDEAVRFYEEGTRYSNENAQLKLALHMNELGHVMKSRYLLATASGSDAQYLLGDHLENAGFRNAAQARYSVAAQSDHQKASARLDPSVKPSYITPPELVQTVDFGGGWKSSVNNLHGGVHVTHNGEECSDLEVPTYFTEVQASAGWEHQNIYIELEEHEHAAEDLRSRSFVLDNYNESAFIRLNSHRTNDPPAVDVGIIDVRSGAFTGSSQMRV